MTLGAPGYLFLLFLGIPVILFHMVRARRRKVAVPSTLLWRLASRDVATTRALRRFLPSALLLLQLLTLVAIAFALARPSTSALSKNAGLTVVVVDASASMQATDVNAEGRLAMAIRQAERKMGQKSAFTVIRAAGEPDVLAERVGRRRALDAMRTTKPCWGECDLSAAISLGESLLKGRNDRLLLLNDDGAVRLADPARSEVVAVTPVGGNVGITSLETQPNPTVPGTYRWLAVVRNYSNRRAEVTANLEVDGNQLYASHIVMAPRASAVLPTSRTGAGSAIRLRDASAPARAILTIKPEGETQNFLAIDDVMRAVVHPRGQVRVAVVRASGQTAESPVLAALSLIPDARISAYGSSSVPPEGAADVTIYEGFSPSEPVKGKVVIVGALPSYVSVSHKGYAARGKETTVEAIDWDRTSELLRFVDLSGVAFGGAIEHRPLPEARVLAESQAGPLIEEMHSSRGTTIVMSFRPEASDLVGQAAFPILMANLVWWAGQPEGPLGEPSVIVGNLIDMRNVQVAGSGQHELTLAAPSGRIVHGAALWQVSEPGFYTLRDGEAKTPIAVNFANPKEADILNIHSTSVQTRTGVVHAATRAADTQAVPISSSDAWRLLLILGVLLLTLEWLGFASGRLGRSSLLGVMRSTLRLRARDGRAGPGHTNGRRRGVGL